MGTTPHNIISIRHQKRRGRSHGGCIKILNKREGVTLYQKTRDSWLFVSRPLRTIYEQPGPTWITPTMLLWLLPAQDTTHDLRNAKQMANKTDTYWKYRSGCSLPLDTCKFDNFSTCIAIVDALEFLCLWSPFGTTPATEEYTTVSEATIDLGNDLLREKS